MDNENKVPFIKIRNLAKWMDESKMRAEFSDYESPIKVIMAEMETKFDGDVLTAVQRYGIDVDREELLKALQYDRDQYEAGYRAGLAKGRAEAEALSSLIGSRYYGPDTCNKCAHRNELMSTGREEPSIFCEHWKLKVNSSDHCSNYEEEIDD